MRAVACDQRIAGVSYAWEGARNASPSVQRISGTVVRRNRAKAPIATPWSAMTGSDGAGTLSKNTLPGGRVAAKLAITTKATAGIVRIDTTAATVSYSAVVSAGETITISMAVASSGGTIRLAVDWYRDDGPWVSASSSSVGTSSCSTDPDSPTRRSLTLTVPAGATRVRPYLYDGSGAYPAVGVWIQGGDLLVEVGSASNPYFDGDTVVSAATINGVTPPPPDLPAAVGLPELVLAA